MFKSIWMVVRVEIKATLNRPQDLLYALCFFFIAISLYPLSLGNDSALLKQVAPACIWLSALFAGLLSMERLFAQDLINGVLEQMLIAHFPLSLNLFFKVFIRWLFTYLPFLFSLALVAHLFDLSLEVTLLLSVSLLIGSFIIVWFIALALILTLQLPQQGTLVGLISLPLCIPVIIFGTNLVLQKESGFNIDGPLALMIGLALLCGLLMPILLATVLKLSFDD